MTRLTLICHAATAAIRAARFPDDEDIAPDGMPPPGAQLVAGRWLCGPERRTASTARALAGGEAVGVDPDLRDWDCGTWRGRDLPALQRAEPAQLAAWLSDPAAAPHGGESLSALLARASAWLDRQAPGPARTAAVTHPAVLRAALVAALDSGPRAFWRVDAPPLCRARFSHDGRRWVLQELVRARPGA